MYNDFIRVSNAVIVYVLFLYALEARAILFLASFSLGATIRIV